MKWPFLSKLPDNASTMTSSTVASPDNASSIATLVPESSKNSKRSSKSKDNKDKKKRKDDEQLPRTVRPQMVFA